MDRAREYAFLLHAIAVAALRAIVHDPITVTISSEHFVYGKGVDAGSLRWGAAPARSTAPCPYLRSAPAAVRTRPQRGA